MAISIQERKRLITNLDNLIRAKTPGTAKDLAKKLRISRSTLYRLFEYLRTDLDAPLIFDRDKKRYIYKEEGRIFFGFIPSRIMGKEFNAHSKNKDI